MGEYLDGSVTWDSERPHHRLLGYATPLQGDPYLTTHVYSVGETFDDWRPGGERERALERGAANWRLLLQIDSEPDNTYLAQDGGYYYVFIPESALARRDFGAAWGVMQCH